MLEIQPEKLGFARRIGSGKHTQWERCVCISISETTMVRYKLTLRALPLQQVMLWHAGRDVREAGQILY